MQTVLGLSMTSTSVGWVLLDRQGPVAFTLDHDAFDVQSTADGTTHDTSQHTAAVRGAQAIATASGHKVGSVRVTWSEDAEADATALLKSLADLGFDNVLSIPLNLATQTWGIEVGLANEQIKTALCILEPSRATVMVVATGAGSVRTAVTTNRDDVADLRGWLTTIFRRDGWLPESLHLVGARDDVDEVAGPIGDALPIPVSDSVDTQLALALGAALVRAMPVAVPPSLTAGDRAEPVPPRDRPRFASHARRLTLSAAAVSIVGAALSLAAGSAQNVENVSAQEANPRAESASVTSPSVHTVPTRISAPSALPAQPLAAQPPPAPSAPPEIPQLPAEPLAAVPEPASVPVREPASVPVRQTVSTPPPAAALAAPAAPVAPPPAAALGVPPGPVAPPGAPLGVPPGPVAPPAAPLGVPPGPVAPPAAPLGVPPGPVVPPAAPLGVPPALIALPPAAPLAAPVPPIAVLPAAPLAAPVPPFAVPQAAPLAVPQAPVAPLPAPEPAEPPPPPDPLEAALSPLVGGLP